MSLKQAILIVFLLCQLSPAQVPEAEKELWLSTLKCTSGSDTLIWKEERSSFLRLSPKLLTGSWGESEGKLIMTTTTDEGGGRYTIKGENFNKPNEQATLKVDGNLSEIKMSGLAPQKLDCQRIAPKNPMVKFTN